MKLESLEENVCIGSHTLQERKFQVVNFMNMFWDNINKPFEDHCMTVDVVAHNLIYEVRKAIEMSDKYQYTDYDKVIFDLIKTIHNNINIMKHLPVKRNWKVIINLNNILWNQLLENLTYYLKLKYIIKN